MTLENKRLALKQLNLLIHKIENDEVEVSMFMKRDFKHKISPNTEILVQYRKI